MNICNRRTLLTLMYTHNFVPLLFDNGGDTQICIDCFVVFCHNVSPVFMCLCASQDCIITWIIRYVKLALKQRVGWRLTALYQSAITDSMLSLNNGGL